MASWIYLFSKFTPEALLFEALFIFILLSSYSSFWILRKRRLGAIESEVPASVVKGYLNELIVDAEYLRTQLFGLLSAGGPMPDAHRAGPSIGTGTDAPTPVDPDLQKKLAAFEVKMREQAQAMEKIMADKAKLERELGEARNKGAKGASAASESEEEVFKLRDKLQQLEARLAEYSVIEDDLANLKRLQQENAQLRAALGNKSGAAAAPSSEKPKPAEPSPEAEPALDPVQPKVPDGPVAGEPALSATPAPMDQPAADAAAPASEPEAATPADPAAQGAATDVNFEGLVDEVEKSLKPGETAPPATNVSTQDAPKPTVEKSDEDLIAEFEKMLNS